MSFVRALLLSVLVHSLLIFAFVELKYPVKVRQTKYVKIDLSFVKIEEKKRTERTIRKVVKASKEKSRKMKKIKRKPIGKTKHRKTIRKEITRKPAPQPKKIKSNSKVEEEKSERNVTRTTDLKAEKPSEKPEAVSMKREEPNPYLPDYPVGIGDEDVEEEESYEEEYEEENLNRIREIVQSYLSYPIIARRMGWEGTVVVRFVLTSEGKVRKVDVEKSSGFEILDRNALEVIKLASKDFPKPSKDVVVVIPVVYRLEE